MKFRNWFGSRACTGLAALLAMTSGTASGKPTLRMRAAPLQLAQAQPTPPPPAQPAPAPAPPEAAQAPTAPTEAPQPAEVVPPTEGEVIVVTGSRIGDPLGKQAPVL